MIRINSTTLNVSWTPLTIVEAQGIILYYQLVYLRVDSTNRGLQINASANASYILIGGLQVGEQYGVSIAAVTKLGVGKISDFVYEDGECHYFLLVTVIFFVDYIVNPSSSETGNTAGIAGGVILFIAVVTIILVIVIVVIFVVRRTYHKKYSPRTSYERQE